MDKHRKYFDFAWSSEIQNPDFVRKSPSNVSKIFQTYFLKEVSFSGLKKALSEYANKDFEPIISPVIRSGFRSASGFEVVFADL